MGFYEVYKTLEKCVSKLSDYQINEFKNSLRQKNDTQLEQFARELESRGTNPQIMDIVYQEMYRRGIRR